MYLQHVLVVFFFGALVHLLMCALMNRHTLQLALVWWCFFIIINNDIVTFQLPIIYKVYRVLGYDNEDE